MTPELDRDSWEARWQQVLRDQPEVVARRPPSEYLVAEAEDLAVGYALDAGCGHGSETLWLAARGWNVTAVDFSNAALDAARSRAEASGAEVARRVDWVHGDLSSWAPEPGRYDLVICLYVHAADGPESLVRRLASGVAPGGTVLFVGHRPVDPATGAPTAAADQVQVSVDEVRSALGAEEWDFVVAEDRVRAAAGTGVDAVVRARRRHS